MHLVGGLGHARLKGRESKMMRVGECLDWLTGGGRWGLGSSGERKTIRQGLGGWKTQPLGPVLVGGLFDGSEMRPKRTLKKKRSQKRSQSKKDQIKEGMGGC